MAVFSDTTLLRDEDLARIRAIVVRQGLPAEWCETPEFRANITRIFTALGGDTHKLVSLVSDVITRPWLRKRLWSLARNFGSVGAAYLLSRTLIVAAFDQPAAAVEPLEIYQPIKGYVPDYELEDIDLTSYKDAFFYEYENEDGSANEAAIDRALASLTPDFVSIGSGPGASAAIASIYDVKPHSRVMVLDVGDYFRQDEYDAQSPTAVGIQSYRGGGSTVIVNGVARVSANFIPQVWGGGAEIFSGTAHAIPDWYRERLPMSRADSERHEARIRRDCRISTTKWEILNDAQKLFYKAAERLGHHPYMLDGFGRGGDRGQGRCYAGKKGRITYLDEMFKRGAPLVGLANCRVDVVHRSPQGRVAALELSFLSRKTRRVIATRLLELPAHARVLLAAGSMGDQKILAASGDALALKPRAGVLHQYTGEVAALFDEPLSVNGIPQGIAVCLEDDKKLPNGDMQRRVVIEGAHPGRALLAAVGLAGSDDPLQTWRVTPRVGTVGIMFTESNPGVQLTFGDTELTAQRLTKHDFSRAMKGLSESARIWREAGARGVALNLTARFQSKHADMRAIGFAGVDEIDDLLDHATRQPPIMQVFYRTGHRFGTVNPRNGEVNGFAGLHLVGEDVIPPGPGVNPTLAIMMVAHHYGESIAHGHD